MILESELANRVEKLTGVRPIVEIRKGVYSTDFIFRFIFGQNISIEWSAADKPEIMSYLIENVSAQFRYEIRKQAGITDEVYKAWLAIRRELPFSVVSSDDYRVLSDFFR